jgi:type II secretory ATPase GspE/PulE/Tfp pilus assembly ATPase PilB-like protein
MGTLRQDGARKVLSGISSIAEVLRATEEEESAGQI